MTPALLEFWLLIDSVLWLAWLIFAAHRFGWRRAWNVYVEFVRGWAFGLLVTASFVRLILKWVTGA